MAMGDQQIDVTKNIKTIEWLKSELLTTIASLFELLVRGVKGTQDALIDVLANIILVTYILGKRLGINFATIDMRIEDKIRLGILEQHKVEDWYGDLSSLKQYLDRNRS
ncbi:MazG-like family protein [Anaerosolibacter sp.]|uniref:MazG-like family protein n=1 Tax=Anaerosolibacter sp. TaxID=1872527 RepID=UPI0039F022B8